MSSFAGTWVDQNDTTIQINSHENILRVEMSNGRGPFHGFELELTSPVLCVNFRDDASFVGALSNDGYVIHWNNGTFWRKD